LKYVLITLCEGIIDLVTFYESPYVAVANLAKYTKDMNPEKNDAAVYGPDGIVANAKIFLDENDQFIHGASVIDCNDEQIYVIADPCYNLVFFAKGPQGITTPAFPYTSLFNYYNVVYLSKFLTMITTSSKYID